MTKHNHSARPPVRVQTSGPQLSRRTLWTIRLILLALLAIWIGGAIYLHQQVQRDRALVEKVRLEAKHQEERARREASYQYQLQERAAHSSRVQNAVDAR